MTDVQEQSVADTEGTNEQAKPEGKAPKVKQARACYCSAFEVYRDGSDDEVFTTGCTQTTYGTFAQGHDARLVSFLVDGHMDGYQIRAVGSDGKHIRFTTPEAAARTASEALGNKAATATANRTVKTQADADKKAEREKAKQERQAAKEAAKAEKAAKAAAAKAEKAAAGPKKTGAEVVAGSSEGDPAEQPEGTTKIKVGRWEYDAIIDPETEVAIYVDGKGEQVEVERDGYRLLQDA